MRVWVSIEAIAWVFFLRMGSPHRYDVHAEDVSGFLHTRDVIDLQRFSHTNVLPCLRLGPTL